MYVEVMILTTFNFQFSSQMKDFRAHEKSVTFLSVDIIAVADDNMLFTMLRSENIAVSSMIMSETFFTSF